MRVQKLDQARKRSNERLSIVTSARLIFAKTDPASAGHRYKGVDYLFIERLKMLHGYFFVRFRVSWELERASACRKH